MHDPINKANQYVHNNVCATEKVAGVPQVERGDTEMQPGARNRSTQCTCLRGFNDSELRFQRSSVKLKLPLPPANSYVSSCAAAHQHEVHDEGACESKRPAAL